MEGQERKRLAWFDLLQCMYRRNRIVVEVSRGELDIPVDPGKAKFRIPRRSIKKMSPTALEKRVAAMEKELTELKNRIETVEPGKACWERIAGTFENDPLYEQAMKLGRKYRKSLGPRKLNRKQK